MLDINPLWKIHKKMKCHKCGKLMKEVKQISFNENKIDGWKCSCGEVYYNSEQAEKVLLLNKLKKKAMRTKLGKIRSNLILRLPKDVENALGLENGKEVIIKIEDDCIKIVP